MGDMAVIDAFWVALVAAYPAGEQRDRATAAIISQVKQVADGVPTFVAGPVAVLNNVFYREVLYQVHQTTPIEPLPLNGAVVNELAVITQSVEWFGALIKLQGKIMAAGKKVMNEPTPEDTSRSNAAMTAAAVGKIMPISAAERERVESGVQMAQNQFLESLELPGCVATIEAVRQDPQFAGPEMFGKAQYGATWLAHAAVRRACMCGVSSGQQNQSNAWFVEQLIAHRDARLQKKFQVYQGDTENVKSSIEKFVRMTLETPGTNKVPASQWQRKGELWIVDCAYQLLGKRSESGGWRYLRPGNFEQLIEMVSRMHHMCEELMPSVFTDEVLAETVAQIEGYENAYKSVETGARVYVGMDPCEATVAYFDQWTAYTYFCLAKELAVFKQDATYLVAIPDMRCYWGPTGTRNGDVTFLALTPGSRALRVNAQRRYSELEQGDPLAGRYREGYRRAENAEQTKTATFSALTWGKLLIDAEEGRQEEKADKRNPDNTGAGAGKGGGKETTEHRQCYQYPEGHCKFGDKCKFWHGDKPPGKRGQAGGRGFPLGDNHGYCWDFQQYGECNADQNCRFWHGDQPPGKRWGGDILGDRHTEDSNEGEHESYFQEVENEESIDVNKLD